MNDASTDMQVLAKNMVAKITDQKCKSEDGKISKSEKVKDYEADLVCNDGEELIKGDSTYKLDLDKFNDFLLEFINKKYYDGKIGFPGWILGIADLYDNPEKKTPSLIRIIDNESGSSSKKGSLVNNSDIVEQLNALALKQVGNGGSEYWTSYGSGADEWCAMFVSWLFKKITSDKPYLVYASGAGDIPRKSVPKGYGIWLEDECSDPSTAPKPGDVILFTPTIYPSDKYTSRHVGYVYDVDDNKVYTVEGNTGTNLCTTSYVSKREYDRKDCTINGYYRPNY